MKTPITPDQDALKNITEDEGVALFNKVHKGGLASFQGIPLVDDPVEPRSMREDLMDTGSVSSAISRRWSCRLLDDKDGVDLYESAHKRGLARSFVVFMLDLITDPVTPRIYPPDCDPNHPGRRRLHPLFVSGVVCLAVLFVVTVYLSFWNLGS